MVGISKEEYVKQKAIDEYNHRINEIKAVEDFLKSKKFPMGTYVKKDRMAYFDGVFEIEEVGKIVGYDIIYDYYRVYFSDRNDYIGVKEEDLELYEGKVPENVRNYDPYKIKRIVVNL